MSYGQGSKKEEGDSSDNADQKGDLGEYELQDERRHFEAEVRGEGVGVTAPWETWEKLQLGQA